MVAVLLGPGKENFKPLVVPAQCPTPNKLQGGWEARVLLGSSRRMTLLGGGAGSGRWEPGPAPAEEVRMAYVCLELQILSFSDSVKLAKKDPP